MTEKWKRKLLFLLPMLLGILGIAGVAFWGGYKYRQADFLHISKFCEILLEHNPEAETEVISALKEYSEHRSLNTKENRFLNQYGYRAEEFHTEENGKIYILSFVCILLFICSYLFLLKYRKRQQQERITELTEYLEKINTGSDGVIMQGTEDDFSKLQDEMYKTVTTLYQTREAAVEAKKNFAENLANIAHQLKTPITSASLSLQLVTDRDSDPHISQVKRQLNRLNCLEEALLTLSRIDTGSLVLDSKEVDVYTALNLAAENLNDLLKKHGISVWIPEKESAVFNGDLEWTMEALMNIMKNCAEHSPCGGKIYCDYSSNPLYVQIQIRDEGEGFSEEDIPYLFERFYRGRQTAGGIGIGLSLTRSIFELQNGTITARNQPDGGACFEIRIYSH